LQCPAPRLAFGRPCQPHLRKFRPYSTSWLKWLIKWGDYSRYVKSFHVNVNACQIYMVYSQRVVKVTSLGMSSVKIMRKLVFAARRTCERERRVVSWELSRREGWVLVDCSKGLRGVFWVVGEDGGMEGGSRQSWRGIWVSELALQESILMILDTLLSVWCEILRGL